MTSPRSTAPEPREPDPDESGDRGSRVMRFGAAVTAVVLASGIATAPAAMRAGSSLHGSAGSLSLWVALLAAAFFPLAIATVILRHALAALRLFDPNAVRAGVATALVWAVSMFLTLSAFGAALRATTHQHALAGVTFAVGGVTIAALLAIVAVRVVPLVRGGTGPLRWIVTIGFALAVGFALAHLAKVVAHGEGGTALSIDIVAFAFAAAFGAGAFPLRSRPITALALAGPPLAAAVLVIGLASLRGSPTLCATLTSDAPVLVVMVDAVCPTPPEKPAEAPPH